MFAEYIKNNLEFINEYFSLLIKNSEKSFPQSIIFYGEDTISQYLLALNLAKILNCKEDKSINCSCINCNWIKENQHPAIITVSKIDFKPDNDSSKTVISVNQTQEIKNMLSTTSEYHRVFILCDAEIKKLNKIETEQIDVIKKSGFALPYDGANKSWVPMGINRKIFQEESANSLLKSIEEPPPKTTFIFLTKDRNDLIETIVSRSQCFFVPSVHKVDNDLDIIKQEFKYYPEIDRLEINNIAQNLIQYAENENISVNNLISKFQYYIELCILSNANNSQVCNKMLEDIKILNNANNELKAYIKPLSVLENTIYKIYKNWEL